MSAELIGKIWLVVLCTPGIVPAVIFYARHRNTTPPGESRFPLGLYVVVLLICAFVAFWAASQWGVHVACSGPSPGNLCGLLPFIIIGPLGSIIAVTAVSWLMTYSPLQMKRVALNGVILVVLASGYYFRGFFFDNVMQQSQLYRYRLQSGNVEDLQRYAPVVEAQMRELPVLKDVRAPLDAVQQNVTVPGVKELPAMTISFSLAPKVALADAIARIHDMEIRLALPPTITSSVARAE